MIKIQHLLHPALVGPGHRVERMRSRSPRKLKPIRPSHKVELWYRGELRSVAAHVRAEVERHIIPALKPMFPGLVADAEPTTAKQLIANLKRQQLGKLNVQAQALAHVAATKSLAQVDERFIREVRNSVSVDLTPYLARSPGITRTMQEKTTANVALIKSIPEVYLDKVENAVSMNWGAGTRWEDLVAEIMHQGDVTEKRAAVIARDQTSKMNAAFNQTRQTEAGIPEYDWETAGDEVVRPAHADMMKGGPYRWDAPGPLAGTISGEPCHPGEDVECRCAAIPRIDIDAMKARIEQLEAAA